MAPLLTYYFYSLIGRTIQGIGAAGILVLEEIIITDLIPLSVRGTWLGIFSKWIVPFSPLMVRIADINLISLMLQAQYGHLEQFWGLSWAVVSRNSALQAGDGSSG